VSTHLRLKQRAVSTDLRKDMEPERARPKLGHIFVEKGFITTEQLEQALAEQSQSGKLLGEVLVELEMIDRLDLASALGVQFTAPPAPAPAPPAPAPTIDRRADVEAELAALRAHNEDLRSMVSHLQAELSDRDERLALLSYFVEQG
jgi:hypothetical protein